MDPNISDPEMTDDSDDSDEIGDIDQIVEREAWLRSFGMTPYTAPGDYDESVVKAKRAEMQEENKIQVDKLPPCEETPGKVTANFKQHLDALKQDCLTSPNWTCACRWVRYAIEQNKIEKMVVLGLSSIFSYTAEHPSWQFEMAFILAIFELVQQQATRAPTLYFQDPDFCDADHLLLSELGGQVVKHPEAFLCHIDERALVFAKFLPLVVYFQDLLQTSPAICISPSLPAATEGALNLQENSDGFEPDFDIRSAANIFIAKRESAELHQPMHDLHTSIPGSVYNLVKDMSVFWLASEEEGDVRQTKQVEPLGKKAKERLESL